MIRSLRKASHLIIYTLFTPYQHSALFPKRLYDARNIVWPSNYNSDCYHLTVLRRLFRYERRVWETKDEGINCNKYLPQRVSRLLFPTVINVPYLYYKSAGQ
jgi:hypothetical protein